MRRALTAVPLALALAAGPALPAAAATPVARGVDDSCPDGAYGEDGFFDISPTDAHEEAVDCLTWWGLANGRSLGRYAPGASVTRGQVASFLARLVERSGGTLPPDAEAPDAFDDDAGSPHERAINRLEAAGILAGTGPRTYSPDAPVTRGQLATLLANTLAHRMAAPLPTTQDYFADDTGSFHELGINRIAQAGLTAGRPDGTYAPQLPPARGQVGSFFTRALDLLVETGFGEAPAPAPAPEFPAEAEVGQGSVVWGVYTLATVAPSNAELEAAIEPLEEAGYQGISIGELGCDRGAPEALGVAEDGFGVSVYFDDEAAVTAFLRAYYPERVVGVARVTLACLD